MQRATICACRRVMLFLLALAVVTGTGCDFNLSDYTPSAEDVCSGYNPSSPFMVEPAEIAGLYGNLDVDSLIYSYRTTANDADAFWAQIDQQAAKSGWQLLKDDEGYRQYELMEVLRKGMELKGQVRIAFDEASFEVLVGWVEQGYTHTKCPPLGEDGSFAEDVVWPKFEEYRNSKK